MKSPNSSTFSVEALIACCSFSHWFCWADFTLTSVSSLHIFVGTSQETLILISLHNRKNNVVHFLYFAHENKLFSFFRSSFRMSSTVQWRSWKYKSTLFCVKLWSIFIALIRIKRKVFSVYCFWINSTQPFNVSLLRSFCASFLKAAWRLQH